MASRESGWSDLPDFFYSIRNFQEMAICKVCKDIFCCAECRYKHEIKHHAIAVQKTREDTEQRDGIESTNYKNTEHDQIYLFCPICEKRPLVLEAELQKEILLHVELFHLPLRCKKCLKIYNNLNDLKDFSKCLSQSREALNSNHSYYADEASKVTVTKAVMPHCIISQNSPSIRQDFNASNITPISVINMRWKAKSKLQHEDFISDSVSSIKNLSSISNSSSRRSMEMASAAKGKVVRCSSTPVHLEMVFAKPKEQAFNATGGHMSSIQYNSGCESDTSPAFSQPSSQALEPVNRFMKVAGSRPRMTAVTPLRQVMSKSIQKAFAEHGLPPSNTGKISYTFQRKNIFDSNSSQEDEQKSPTYPALDLRLSPAVRRSQSKSFECGKNQSIYKKESNDLPYLRREIMLSAKKLTTESIVITRTEHLSSVSSSNSAVSSNFSVSSVKPNPKSTYSTYQSAESNSTRSSIFQSCSSVEIITATTEEIQKLHSLDEERVKDTEMQPNTPITRIPGLAIHKKLIKFETPKKELSDSQQSQHSPNDEFFTPSATPFRYNNKIESAETKQRKLLVKHNLNEKFSTLLGPSIKECAHSTAISRFENVPNVFDDLNESSNEDDEVFLPIESENKSQEENCDKINQSQKPAGLWSIMTSVMRLPSFKGKTPKESLKNGTHCPGDSSSNSVIKRCASIAGSLVKSKSLVDENELSSLKRKRTYTTDNQSTSSYLAELSSIEASSPTSNLYTSSKRFRIQGRRPIARMRLNS